MGLEQLKVREIVRRAVSKNVGNARIQTVPANIVAGMSGFGAEEFFEIEAPAERQAPKVEF
ncbi:LemA family protein [Candidatus Sumerlaeota bacterium]|nr:LemA family protein [Candidatus Sumerlaeota bacterium]